MTKEHESLKELSSLHGILPSFRDITGRVRRAGVGTVVKTLQALGVPISRPAQARDLVAARRAELAARVVEPVVVSWEGAPVTVSLRFPANRVPGSLTCRLATERGEVHERRFRPRDFTATPEGSVVLVHVHVARRLPPGYHRLTFGGRWSSLLIRAPRRVFASADEGKWWGVFAPLYALYSERWPAGDLSRLEELMSWVANTGGSFVGTLPLLPVFLDEPFEPSPYAPVSRLFWNEFYLDPLATPGGPAPGAAKVVASAEWKRASAAAAGGRLIDYRPLMALKRRAVEAAAEEFFRSDRTGGSQLRRFLAGRPDCGDYAAFRARTETAGVWHRWGSVRRTPGPAERRSRRYHVFAQWALDAAMERLKRESSTGLYLDLPLGFHPDGYDAWRFKDRLAWGVSAGAPPDRFFRSGQDWGFPPFHPERIREGGHEAFRASIRHLFRYASLARVDHIMGLSRLYWIPAGMPATEGVYVRYPAEDLYAVICIESRRSGTVVVGEDLGTVPAHVRAAMRRHGILRSSVFLFDHDLDSVSADSMATVNTHDLPTVAGWWKGRDIAERAGYGFLSPAAAAGERASREAAKEDVARRLRKAGLLTGAPNRAAVQRAATAGLGGSPARYVMVSMEDLWGEEVQQNLPGTGSATRPNWRRRARYPLGEAVKRPEVRGALRLLKDSRKAASR